MLRDGRRYGSESGTLTPQVARLASVNLSLLVPGWLVEERPVTLAAARDEPCARPDPPSPGRRLGPAGEQDGADPAGRRARRAARRPLRQTARVVDLPGFVLAIDRRVFTVAMKTSAAFVLGSSIARAARRTRSARRCECAPSPSPADSPSTEEGLKPSCSRRCSHPAGSSSRAQARC